ncbi:branched-chain amino acid ABC transporter permease [Undibacterium arcticum]
MISIGQQAFVGIGGYGLFLMANHGNMNPFIAVLVGGIIAAILAVPTAKIVFFAYAEAILRLVPGSWQRSTGWRFPMCRSWGGGSGQSLTAMSGIPKATRESITFWIASAMAIGLIALIYWLLRSRFGVALTAIRDSEAASESQGVDVERVKFYVYVLSAFGSGLVGALYYLNVLRIAPNSAFDLSWVVSAIFLS